MFEIKGKYCTAICYASVADSCSVEQIRRMCNHVFTDGSKIRIMPDVHAGKGCTIGTTMTITDKVVPNVVGVDIGCGMYTINLGNTDIDFRAFDAAAHRLPSGRNLHRSPVENFNFKELRCYANIQNLPRLNASLGTLGGGNHFIEIDEATDGTKYLVIHSGSRNLGKQVAEYYHNLAIKLNYNSKIPEDLCHLSGNYLNDYLHDVNVCQLFALRNREIMGDILLNECGLNRGTTFHTVHNYIDTKEMILRKGAIAAHSGEMVLIPINMRDGSIIARGIGNPEWNYSAPHGAGRVLSRTQAKNTLSMDEFRETMQGIYTTSVSSATLDESPMAYKSIHDIIDVINDSVDIIDVLKPVYNFKA
ncbi:RtcB family protein [uncultured Ruminobacter sp.]|uniref:RtcB family protein n=2 Tax=Ruminobacter TaxID=866 RepID=UPI0025D85DC6|nr:RtcB family protein [uncultured Ruminobacter sp.]